jgi:hypothetical protein
MSFCTSLPTLAGIGRRDDVHPKMRLALPTWQPYILSVTDRFRSWQMKLTERTSSPFDRLDAVRMSAHDREQARAMMRNAEAFASVVLDLQKRVSDGAAAMARAFAFSNARFKSAVRTAFSQGAHR